MDLFAELMALTKALDERSVDYALVGGLAVAVWGAPRATKDIDLLILPSAIDRAKEAAAHLGFVLAAGPIRFRDGVHLERVSRVREGQLLTIDFMLVNENLMSAWESRKTLSTTEGAVSVISRDSLIAMKLAAARPQDIADVEKLQDIDR